MNLWLAFFLSAVVSYFGCFVAIAFLRRFRIIDQPNQRSSHDKPIVRGGGVAVLIAAGVVGSLFVHSHYRPELFWIVLAGTILAAVSFVDDLCSLPQILRFGVHICAALFALTTLGFAGSTNASLLTTAFVAVVGFLWITGYTNAFNFMDGINGMAGMQVVTTGIGTALVALSAGGSVDHPAIVLAIVLAGAGAGFLPHNFPRAHMFLGDVGSVPLGFFLAVFAFWLARDLGWWLLFAFGLLHGNFIVDTSVTLARRIRNGERWFEPHREHFYQRLLRAGLSHPFVTGLEGLIQVVVLSLVLVAVKMGWAARITSVAIICLIWIAFFVYAESKFRRSLVIETLP